MHRAPIPALGARGLSRHLSGVPAPRPGPTLPQLDLPGLGSQRCGEFSGMRARTRFQNPPPSPRSPSSAWA